MAHFAGLSLDGPRLMGIVNVTPDSFSDGGDFAEPRVAVAHGLRLVEEGADILDVGGESTRPGAAPIGIDEELRRVLPVIEGLAGCGVPISIDTRHARVMREAVRAGASIINDISALSGDPESMGEAARLGPPVVLMHMQGQPGTMQADPRYDDVVAEVRDYLAARVAACEAAGIGRDRIAVDPGIGFGKTVAHNLALLANLDVLAGIGCPVLLGASRKSFIGALGRGEPPRERVAGSVAAVLAAAAQGVRLFRVHDVAQTRQALSVWLAISSIKT